jgi:hypothetical protein
MRRKESRGFRIWRRGEPRMRGEGEMRSLRHLNESPSLWNGFLMRFLKPLRLNAQGHPIGLKLLDLLLYREAPRTQTRPLHIIALLQFITNVLWKHLFSRPADNLEKSSNPETPDEYMISDNEPLVNQYISVPKEMSQLNCAAFVAGIIEGVCDGAAFPARVTAHSVGTGEEGELWPGKTVFLVKFQPEIVEREAYLSKN